MKTPPRDSSFADWLAYEALLSHHKMASWRCSDAGDPPQAHGPKKHHDGEGLSLFQISLSFKSQIEADFHSRFAPKMPGSHSDCNEFPYLG